MAVWVVAEEDNCHIHLLLTLKSSGPADQVVVVAIPTAMGVDLTGVLGPATPTSSGFKDFVWGDEP